MKIGLLTAGSRGDIQPFIALASGLLQQGYEVCLIAPQNFSDIALRYEIAFHPVALDMQAILQGESGDMMMTSNINPLKLVRSMRDMVRPIFIDAANDTREVLADCDLVIMHQATAVLGTIVCEYHQIPFILASPAPLLPTRNHPAIIFPSFSLGAWYNRLSYTLFMRIIWSVFAEDINKLRGLWKMPLTGFRGMYRSGLDNPFMVAISPTIYPKPSDFLPHQEVVGYWLLDEPDWQPPAELATFLASGEKPIYIGFGSMNVQDPEQTISHIVGALDKLGKRGILLTGWSKIGADNLPAHIMAVDNVPHDWLFPQMEVVVHHGGAGTTASGILAGVPTVVVPFIADQPFWGKRLADMGIGSAPLPYKQLSAEHLAQAIESALQPQMRKRSQTIAAQVRTEDGIARAIAFIKSRYE